MNIGEANDVNAVLRHLLAELRGIPSDVPEANQARESAARLADRAHNTLGAGLFGRNVLERMRAHCADELVDDGPDGEVRRYCCLSPDHRGVHDDMDVVWPNT